MHPVMIQAALKMRGVTQSEVARRCRVVPTGVYQVIHGRSRSRKIEICIAVLTGLSLAELWPQWHGPDASRRRRRPIDVMKVAEAMRSLESRAAA